VSKKISFGLSVSEINRAVKELRQYQAEINYKCQKLAEKLAEEGVFIARLKIAEYDAVYTSELLQSIKSEYGGVVQNGATWIVYTDCPHAAWVEFGTGIVGSQSPHPDTSLVNWRYDVNEHGEAGWFYFNSTDGKWHWTKGMISRPFMFETGQELHKLVSKVAKEVFGSG
jgi:hypothetical protein